MNNKVLHIFLLLLIIIVGVYPDTTTLILQNGVNGYTGTVDSYLEDSVFIPKGSEDTLIGKYG